MPHCLFPVNRLLSKAVFEKLPGVGVGVSSHVCRDAGDHDFADADAAFRSQVDDPVGGLDDVEVVFDDDDGVAMIAQPVQHRQQLRDIVEMQAGGGFIQYIECLAGVAPGKFARQLDALCFTAGQCGRILSQG